MKAPNGARVVRNSDGSGTVHLGWGRGRIIFTKNKETGELEWSDPSNCPDPNIQALLINRAKAIYKENASD
tara:strand:- start:106 stop:318 length:213 start_codon:yes stop_codon:yes gene_type:complete